MLWFRIDNRLVHGQVIETWLPYLEATRLLVVNDAIAQDKLQQSIMSMAIPDSVEIEFLLLLNLGLALNSVEHENTLVLFANCQDARKTFEMGGASFTVLNVGNLHYGPGKKQICVHVAVSEDDASCLCYLREHGVELDFRSVPNDSPRVEPF